MTIHKKLLILLCSIILLGCTQDEGKVDPNENLAMPATEKQDVPLSDVGIYTNEHIDQITTTAEKAANEVSDVVLPMPEDD